jgi:serine/threonine protein kinase
MHEQGFMHRNLKPENALVNHCDQVVLTDFTMARLMVREKNDYTPEDPKERYRSGREARRLWYRAPELLFRTESYT